MVVSSGDEGRPRWRTECRRVELCITQPHLGEPVHRRRGNHAAECTTDTVALVIGHDQQNIGRTLWWNDRGGPAWLGTLGVKIDDATEGRRRIRKISTVSRGGGAG